MFVIWISGPESQSKLLMDSHAWICEAFTLLISLDMTVGSIWDAFLNCIFLAIHYISKLTFFVNVVFQFENTTVCFSFSSLQIAWASVGNCIPVFFICRFLLLALFKLSINLGIQNFPEFFSPSFRNVESVLWLVHYKHVTIWSMRK